MTMATSAVSAVKDATASQAISSDTDSSYDGDDSLEKRSSEGEKLIFQMCVRAFLNRTGS